MSCLAQVDTTVFTLSFAVYTLAIVVVGLYSARFARRSDEDYFLAGRSLGPWVAALSASASSESGWVTLGLVGWAFSSGIQAYWIIPGCLVGFMFNWFVVAGRMRDRSLELGALTLPDFFSFNFRERLPILRVLAVIVILVAMVLYVAAQLAAAGKAFAASFEIEYVVGVLVGAVIVLLYTVIGGFRAVCWTDFLQALLMIGTLVVFPIYLLFDHGGFDFIDQQLSQSHPEMLNATPNVGGMALLGFLLGHGALGINLGYPGQPHVLVRFMALRKRSEARLAGCIAVVWGGCVYFGAVTVGLMARALTIDGVDWAQQMAATPNGGDLGLVLSAMHLLPGVIAGFVLAAVLAAICSTADSQLVVAASAAANDLYARLFSRDPQGAHTWVNRTVVAAIGVVAVLLVIDQDVQVYSYVLTYGWAILGAAFGPQMILLLLWKRASYAGCVGGMLTGFVMAIVWKVVFNNTIGGIEAYNLTVAFFCATVVNVLLSLLVPSEHPPGALPVPTPRSGFPVEPN